MYFSRVSCQVGSPFCIRSPRYKRIILLSLFQLKNGEAGDFSASFVHLIPPFRGGTRSKIAHRLYASCFSPLWMNNCCSGSYALPDGKPRAITTGKRYAKCGVRSGACSTNNVTASMAASLNRWGREQRYCVRCSDGQG